jgi:hypothetical protein
MKNGKKIKFEKLIPWVILIIAFSYLIFFLYTRVKYLLDSDMSSELVLSKILLKEKTLVTKNFFYSTEIRIVNTNIIYSILFLLSSSWKFNRVASSAIAIILMLISYYYLCKQANIKCYYALSSVILVLPFSITYFNFALKCSWYIIYIIYAFLTIGIVLKSIKIKNKKQNVWLITIASVIALLAGMMGQREIVILYIPLFGSCFIIYLIDIISKKQKKIKLIIKSEYTKLLCISIIFLFFSGIGYLINKFILSKIYSFQIWNNVNYTKFQFKRLHDFGKDLLTTLGYSKIGKIPINFLISLIFIILIAFCIINGIVRKNKVSKENTIISIFIVVNIIIFALLYCFTDLMLSSRYNLPFLILGIPLLAINLKDLKIKNKYKNLISYSFVVLILISSILIYNKIYSYDTTKDLRIIVKKLKNDGYKNGYASFWNANIITELSNGYIDMRAWIDSGVNGDYMTWVDDIDYTNEWLQLKNHKYTNPNGKIFLIYRPDELYYCTWKDKLTDNYIIYKSDNYVVYGYDNYGILRKKIDE